MADAFTIDDAIPLLRGKHILFIGDSNIRAQYKDLVWLLNSNTLISSASLRNKLEANYLGDSLVHRSKLHRGRDFEEVRNYIDEHNNTEVDFMFVPRCYNNKIENLFYSFKRRSRHIPDVIVMNSCLWDLCRWGPHGAQEYKDNMVKLMRLMGSTLPKECLVIWLTALPVSGHVRGGLIIKQIECMESLLKFDIMEANTYAREVVVNHGYDVLDNHFFIRMQVHRRAKDGVHYLPVPIRFMTNLLLTHISLSWGKKLPENISSFFLDKVISQDSKFNEEVVKIPSHGIFSNINHSSPAKQRTRGLQITVNDNEDGHTSRHCKLYQEGFQYQQRTERFHRVLEYPQNHDDHRNTYYQNQESSSPSFWRPIHRRNKRRYKKKPYANNTYHFHY